MHTMAYVSHGDISSLFGVGNIKLWIETTDASIYPLSQGSRRFLTGKNLTNLGMKYGIIELHGLP